MILVNVRIQVEFFGSYQYHTKYIWKVLRLDNYATSICLIAQHNTYQKLVSQEYLEKSKHTVLDYLSDNPLSTAREIGRGCHQRHTIIIQITNVLLKENRIGALRFPKLKTWSKKKTDTRSYYVRPTTNDIEDDFLKIISLKKIRVNRFKKFKYQNRNVWTFEILLKNAINTFHQEFKIFKLEKNRNKSRSSEKSLMSEFHREFIEYCKQGEPPEPYAKMEPMDYYRFIFDEKQFFIKRRLGFLKASKASLSRILEVMQKKHEWGDHRLVADEIRRGNKATKKLLDRITDSNGKFDYQKFVSYQNQEKFWLDPKYDKKVYSALLYSGATKKDILDYIYSHGTDYYLLSDKQNKLKDKKASSDVKNANKKTNAKRRANLKD